MLHGWFAWMAKVQFLPAVLSMNVAVVVAIVILTLLLGRVYCSVICPLGVYQDVVSWLYGRMRKQRRRRFSPLRYPKAIMAMRIVFLVMFVALMVGGLVGIASLIAPYSAYGRFAQNVFQPVYMLLNNGLAYVAERLDSYAFYSTTLWIRSMPVFIVGVVTWIVITALAIYGGRSYCNSVCPVGTMLGILARFSFFRIRIDESKCKRCRLCERGCKAQAICVGKDSVKIDYTRCVDCMNCIGTCKNGAMSYSAPAKQTDSADPAVGKTVTETDSSRRAFLATSMTTVVTAALAQSEKKVDGGFAVIEDKVIPERQTKILPPGARDARHFSQHCTGCQLCVSECNNDVLRPSTGLSDFMQPYMSFEKGYCRTECYRCSEVCPTDALRLADAAEKVSTKVGQAHWIKKNCLAASGEVKCDNCYRHCPAGAIDMVPMIADDENSPKIPAIDETRCIGCGACENLCPARPLPAIVVEGVEQQRTI